MATVAKDTKTVLRQLKTLDKSGELRCCYEAVTTVPGFDPGDRHIVLGARAPSRTSEIKSDRALQPRFWMHD